MIYKSEIEENQEEIFENGEDVPNGRGCVCQNLKFMLLGVD